MNKILLAALLATGLITAPAFAADAPATAKSVPAVIVGGSIKAEAEVIAIDPKTRKFTLKGEDGKTQEFTGTKEMRNLPQVKVGDRVIVEYDQLLALRLKKGPGLRQTDEREGAARTAAGEKPGAVAVKETHFVADVINVNKKTGVVTIKGAKGRIVDLKIKDKAVLADITVNDQVEGVYEQALALIVLPPAAAK